MAVKVLIKRTIPEDRVQDLMPLFTKLRTLATNRSGYISGETLQRVDKPDEFLVISTWESADDWNNWMTSQERNEIQGQRDTLLFGTTAYEVFHYGFGR